jgi:hypothetical protein
MPATADEASPEITAAAEPGVPVVLRPGEGAGPPASKRRVTGGRAAIAGLAEALARAEDPALADLPGAREAAEALAALQREVGEMAPPPEAEAPEAEAPEAEAPDAEAEAEAPEAEAEAEAPETVTDDIQAAFAPPMERLEPAEPEEGVPMEAAPAEAPTPEPISEPAPEAPPPSAAIELPTPQIFEPPSPYTTEVVEPDWFADGDFAWLDADRVEPQPMPDVGIESEPVGEPEAAADAGRAELDHIAHQDESAAVDALQDAFDEPLEAPSPEAPSPEAPFLEAPSPEAPSPESARPAATAWPSEDRHSITGAEAVGFNLFREPSAAAPAPASASPDQEEELLWLGDEFEAAELEVAGAGWRSGERLPAAVSPEPAAAPESEPTPEDAAEAVEPEPIAEPEPIVEPEPLAEPEPIAEPEHVVQPGAEPPGGPEAPAGPQHGFATPPPEPAAAEPERPSPPGPRPAAGSVAGGEGTFAAHLDQDWLRGRRGPAATAYRRLRRLFQG